MMRIIGITGSSGAGKTEVSETLRVKYNAYLIDADVIAKKITNNNKNCLKEIASTFGNDIIDEKGKLKRKELAKIIYSSRIKRKKLNDITFKYILEEISKKIDDAKMSGYEYVLIDAPLLFEIGLDGQCDLIIGVIGNKRTKAERISERDSITMKDAMKRIKAQHSNKYFEYNCDCIIENNYKTLKELETHISDLKI